MSDVNSGFAEVNGTRLYYAVAGAGTPLVLIHGFALDRRMWDYQFADLARHWRVARYDLRGFGRSALPVAGEGYRHPDDLVALLDHLDMDQAALAGLSLGGLIALNTALIAPDRVSRLVLVDAVVSGRPMSPAWSEPYGRARSLAHAQGIAAGKQAWLDLGIFGPARQNAGAEPLLARITDEWSGWQFANRDPENTTVNAMARLGEVRAPTLVVVGERDEPDFLAIADELLAIPLARKLVIPGAGHMAPLEAPAEFNAGVTAFLQG